MLRRRNEISRSGKKREGSLGVAAMEGVSANQRGKKRAESFTSLSKYRAKDPDGAQSFKGS